MTHPNEVPNYTPTPDDLRQMFSRTEEQLAGQKAARERAEQWPGNVERALLALAHEVAALRERVDAVEATVGTVRD